MHSKDLVTLTAIKFQLDKAIKDNRQFQNKLILLLESVESMLEDNGIEKRIGESRLKEQKGKGIV